MRRLVTVLAALVVVAAVAFELGSPYWTRREATDAAKAAASAGAHSLASTRDAKAAESAAAKVAAADGVILEGFIHQVNGTVKVTVSKEARSYLLRRFSATRDWYEIKESATATGG